MDQIRRENLELLVREAGTLAAVAALAETTSVYLSQVRRSTLDRKTGRPRAMGPNIARRLEQGFGKVRGWMDRPHAASETHDPAVVAEEVGASATKLTLTRSEVDLVLAYRAIAAQRR